MPVIFTNPGELDIQGLKTFGLHSKPNSESPIGFFGTGLKYAIAVFIRNNASITIFLPDVTYRFYGKEKEFRGTNYQAIMMRQKRPNKRASSVQLAFTTELGKNWKPWMAFRELESNVRDESGSSYMVNDEEYASLGDLNYEGETSVVVEGLDEDYYECFHGSDEDLIFLPSIEDEEPWIIDEKQEVHIYRRPSKHVYYKGIRSYELSQPSKYTYNMLADMELTEDRTLKYLFFVTMSLAKVVRLSKDVSFITNVIGSDSDKFFEGTWEIDEYGQASQEFLDILADMKSDERSKRAASYYRSYQETVLLSNTESREQQLIERLNDAINNFSYEEALVELLEEVISYLEEVG